MKSKFILTSFVAILLLFTGCGDDGGGGEGVDPELNPEITSVSPQEGTPGTEVTISGSDFSSTASENTVTFGGVEAEVTDASSSKLVTVVPDGAESGAVKVTVDGNTATGPSFTVLEGSKLAITAVEPDSAAIGTAVTIRGMDFSATADENTVTFNGTPATVTAAAEDSLVTEVPEGATSGPIEVTVGGETVSFDGFVVLEEGDNPPPEASSIAATIQNDPELSTLAGLLDGTELQATLEGEGPYTILAPTDDVLATMPNFNATQLEDILSYHVI
ncbi:MAG TPA: IPT/TIG domain-containing protein, partial [Balneolaceae bacterium]|nr:IPT/TIG domain-containing protein [Balneolaceae bacterium]